MDSTNTQRDKRGEALEAYRNGTARDLPADNPYRWLVQNHDGNPQHRGFQPNCPVCDDCDEWAEGATEMVTEQTRKNPAVAYLPRHAATRNTIGRRPLPWQRLDGTDVAISLDVDAREGTATLILTSDHDEVHIRLTPQQVEKLSDRFIEATYVMDPNYDGAPVERWQVTQGVSAAESHAATMRLVEDIESGQVA